MYTSKSFRHGPAGAAGGPGLRDGGLRGTTRYAHIDDIIQLVYKSL